MPGNTPLKIAILWHMHQPNYQEAGSSIMVLPWVRLHALKDYLDMPLSATEFENVKVTFNLVPALIDQLRLYLEGGSDRHLDLSRIAAHKLTEDQRRQVLESSFQVHPPTMIEPYPRYRELYRKLKQNVGQSVLPALFSSEEMRDLQVWSNLAWIDPVFRREEPVKSLFAKGRHYTESEKQSLVDWQLTLIGRIIPTYARLFEQGRIDLSFTPYYHPILPLLCDTDSALEALPAMTLPRTRFCHPEDAEWQITQSKKLFEGLFGQTMQGMWPSEGSVSEAVARLMIKHGIAWTATDEDILTRSQEKAAVPTPDRVRHAVYEYGPGLKILFRDRTLSDRIGFVYSAWDADKAVADIIGHLKSIRASVRDRLDQAVVTIILDGENAWEYFPKDGHNFLTELYRQLDSDAELETVTMTQAAHQLEARPLPTLFAGSWVNNNFRIWIGHPEDNAAWELLSRTRQVVEAFGQEHPDYDAIKLAAAWRQVHIAEGSDWCWWYGDEHRGPHNKEFDRIYRGHLAAAYKYLGLDVPPAVLRPIYQGAASVAAVQPDTLITPTIDGLLSHFYEWAGSGALDCTVSDRPMHHVDTYLSKIFFAYDRDCFYIRVDFGRPEEIHRMKQCRVQITFYTPGTRLVVLPLGRDRVEEIPGQYRYRFEEILEIAVEREFLWPQGHGSLGFSVALMDDDRPLQAEPKGETIEVSVFEKNQELFWPS